MKKWVFYLVTIILGIISLIIAIPVLLGLLGSLYGLKSEPNFAMGQLIGYGLIVFLFVWAWKWLLKKRKKNTKSQECSE